MAAPFHRPSIPVHPRMKRGMPAARSRTVRRGDRAALRQPNDVAFGEDVGLVSVRAGDVVNEWPASLAAPEMIGELRTSPAPPTVARRETDELPERPAR